METRNNKQEFNMLKSFLQEIGVYEHGLDILEMRKIYKMIKESIEENADHNFNISLDSSSKLQEQEIENNEQSDFSLSKMCCNSTMIIDNSEVHTNIIESGFQSSENISLISPISSPEHLTPPRKIIVYADVHHEFSYSPLKSKLNENKINPCNLSSSSPLQSCDSKDNAKINKNSNLEQNPNTDKDSGVETSGIKSNGENEIKQQN